MNEQDLLQSRRHKWRLDGNPIRTLEDAQEFIESVGFCLMYPVRPPALVPTFIGAYVGADERLPLWQHAFADPRAKDATELMVRLLRSKHAFEASVFGETNFLVSASVFPFFYGLVGDRNPRAQWKPGTKSEYTPLAQHVFEVIRHGAASKLKLRAAIGQEFSEAALDRALNELWSRLRITRVNYSPEEGSHWDALYRWAPEAVREGMNMSVPEALSALVSKYLDCVVAADQDEIGEFFSHFVARSKVNEAIHALLAARELQFEHVGSRPAIQVAPPRGVARAAREPRPNEQRVNPTPEQKRRQPLVPRDRRGGPRK